MSFVPKTFPGQASSGFAFRVDSSPLESAMAGLATSFSTGFARSVGEAQSVATRAVKLNFKTGGHGTWAPPAPSTLKRRKSKKTPPALTDTGQLQGAFASPGAPGSVSEQNPFGFVRGTDRIDAPGHQKGRKRKGKLVEPPRPFATLSQQEEDQIVEIVAADVRGRCKKVETGRL